MTRRATPRGAFPAIAMVAILCIALLVAGAWLRSGSGPSAALLDATFVPAPSPPPGVIVTSLRTGGVAESVGLAVGDEVLDIDGRPAPSVAALRADLADDRRAMIGLHVRRDNDVVEVHLSRHFVGESRWATAS